MDTWETVTMSRKEAPRAGLLKAALAGDISNAALAGALHVSVRHAQRLKTRYRQHGASGLVHRSRGRPSGRELTVAVRARVQQLLATTYRGVNDCQATEKLRDVDGLAISRATVQRVRRALGLPAKHRRRPRQYRARRVPEARMGALVQVDASLFAWLEDRGPRLTLHGAIDDATGTVVGLVFRPTEDLHGYAELLYQVATTYGLPVSLYGDRLNVFVRNDRHWTLEEQLQGAQQPTHFGQMLRTLGIGFIAAGSPQAKGRIERLWRTLQDRLTSELRLRAINTAAAAQAYLPTFRAAFNARFAHPPVTAAGAWRPAPADLAGALSCRYRRVVSRDDVIRLGDRLVQLPPGPQRRSHAGLRVEVLECVDGRLLIRHEGRPLATQPAPGPDFRLVPRAHAGPDRRRPQRSVMAGQGLVPTAPPVVAPVRSAPPSRRPALSHPWRQRQTGFSPRRRRLTPRPG